MYYGVSHSRQCCALHLIPRYLLMTHLACQMEGSGVVMIQDPHSKPPTDKQPLYKGISELFGWWFDV